MNTVEEQVRAALRAQAETFSAYPGAWQQLVRRSRAAAERRLAPRRTWPASFIVPAAAAAAVVVIVVVATFLVDGVPGRTGAGISPGERAQPTGSSPGAVQIPAGLNSSIGLASQLLLMVPPTSAIIGLKVPWTGPEANQVESYFWLGHANPAYWVDQIALGSKLCHDIVNVTTGESSGSCSPWPQLSAGHLARVTGSLGIGTNQAFLVGAAVAQVASVTVVLPDGRAFAGVVKTGRGFADRVWTVGYPSGNGVRLVFRDASGHKVATLGPPGQVGPPRVAQPNRGGVTVFQYPAGQGTRAGSVVGYLISGRVGFWSPYSGGLIAQVPAVGEPALGGVFVPFAQYDGYYRLEKAFGYAHADVSRVVLRLPSGQQVSTSTFAADWPGSEVRLWAVSIPSDTWQDGQAKPTITATGYDAAGHVVGQVQLGRPGR